MDAERAAAAEARKTRLKQRVAEAAASSSTRGNGSTSTSLETRRSRAALRLAEVTSRTAATLERLGRETAELAKRKAELEKERAEMAEENATLTDHETRASKRRNQTREHEALLRAYLGDALDGVVADVSARRRAAPFRIHARARRDRVKLVEGDGGISRLEHGLDRALRAHELHTVVDQLAGVRADYVDTEYPPGPLLKN